MVAAFSIISVWCYTHYGIGRERHAEILRERNARRQTARDSTDRHAATRVHGRTLVAVSSWPRFVPSTRSARRKARATSPAADDPGSTRSGRTVKRTNPPTGALMLLERKRTAKGRWAKPNVCRRTAAKACRLSFSDDFAIEFPHSLGLLLRLLKILRKNALNIPTHRGDIKHISSVLHRRCQGLHDRHRNPKRIL